MHPELTNQEYLQELLQKNGIVPERSAGQNFLICDEPLQAFLTALEGGGESVTELGAGVGPLTLALVNHGYSVRAIERDPRLAALLQKGIPKKQRAALDLRVGDFREISWEWPSNSGGEDTPKWQLVGNIPYNLSGYIIRRLTDITASPTQAIFMVQREVGQRLAAEVPNMNLLGLAAQLWGTVHPLLNVPQSCFWPIPAVDSQVILLVRRTDRVAKAEREAVLRLARVFFQHKRKQMGGVLRRAFAWPPEQVNRTLQAVSIAPTARPQEVSVKQWRALTKRI